MTELFKELLGVYKEKTKLPIVSTYVILLIVWNWDILSIYLFSSVNMETRICWIKNLVPGVLDHLCRVLFPAAISFSYPFITNKLMYYTDKWLNKSITERTEILNKRRINTAEARFKIKEAELGTSDLKQLEAQILELEGKRDSLTTSLESANEENKKLNSSLESANDQNKSLNTRLKSAIDAYETNKKELDYLSEKSVELDEIIKYLPNYEELIELNKEVLANENDQAVDYDDISYARKSSADDNISKLISKYSLLMNRWSNEKINFFVNMRRGQHIGASEKSLFLFEEFQELMKDGVFKDNPIGLVTVTDIGDNLSMYLKYKRASE